LRPFFGVDKTLRSVKNLSTELLDWYLKHKRTLPWRLDVHPYHTWVSEVMSQQTTLAVVVPRYLKFLEHFSTIDALYEKCVKEKNEELMRTLWQGLGYYARARNLVKGIVHVVEKCGAEFPNSMTDWLKVPGVGPYTASVLASVHSNEAVACVDGNVTRVVARTHGLDNVEDVWTAQGQLRIRARAQNWMNEAAAGANPGDFNQAMMELGAMICTKHQPKCGQCPVSSFCVSFEKKIQQHCPPVKPKKEKVKLRVVVWLFERDSSAELDPSFFVSLRTKGFLKSTRGFPLTKVAEEASPIDESQFSAHSLQMPLIAKHTITNHQIELRAARVNIRDLEKSENGQASGSVAKRSAKVEAALEMWRSVKAEEGAYFTLDELFQNVSTSLDVKVLKWLQKVRG
jgi:A/G-specific adenine glycosylase